MHVMSFESCCLVILDPRRVIPVIFAVYHFVGTRKLCCVTFATSGVTVSIDNIHTYGYETNHVSALISTRIGPILVSGVKKTYPGFVILRGNKCLQVLQIIYMSGFVDYLLGETAN